MKKTLRNLANFAGLYSKIPDIYWLNKILNFNIDPSQIIFDKDNHNIFIKDLNISLDKNDRFDFIFKAIHYAQVLKYRANAHFKILNGELYVSINDINLNVQTWEEFYILNEIFIEGVYNIVSSKPTVILDIGMNTGFASLFFSQKQNILAVFGYEPIQETFEQAKYNLALNPVLSKKINPYNFGLSASTHSLLVDYAYEHKGSIGINGIPIWVSLQNKDKVKKVELSVVQADEVIDLCLDKYPDVNIIAKIDCEGSEYKIIESLFLCGKIMHLKGLLIEWHDASKNDVLLYQLTKSGFEIVHLNPTSSTIGMLYAFRN